MSLELHIEDALDGQKFEILTGLLGDVISPTAANLVNDAGVPCRSLSVTVEAGEIRYRIDGGTPGAAVGNGHQVIAGQSFVVGNVGNCSRFMAYCVAGSTLAVTFGF